MGKFTLGAVAVLVFLAFSAAPSSAGEQYWKGWPEGQAKGLIPPCGTNVLALGGDDILQATVDTYCALKPGQYVSYINPKAMDAYKKKAASYPDGQTGVLAFPDINVAFTTEHKDGGPIYDVIDMQNGKSISSNEPNHPLNPATCARCHASYKGVCKGYVCGNRM